MMDIIRLFDFVHSETISTEIFYIIQRQMDQYYEMIVTDKKRIPIWSYRLHLALEAYKVRRKEMIDGIVEMTYNILGTPSYLNGDG